MLVSVMVVQRGSPIHTNRQRNASFVFYRMVQEYKADYPVMVICSGVYFQCWMRAPIDVGAL